MRVLICSRREGIIVNVSFYAKFLRDRFDFSSECYALADFLRCALSEILSQPQFQQLNSIGGNLLLKVKW